jgi:hypothetical protein
MATVLRYAKLLRIPLAYFVLHTALYAYLTRATISRHVIHVPLDDMIPYVPAFVIPYYIWFALVAGTLAYYLLKKPEWFGRLCAVLFVGMAICDLVFVLYPSSVQLWPKDTGDGILARLVDIVYTMDRPVNVFPSIHVGSSVGIFWVNLRSGLFRGKPARFAVSFLLTVSIWLSTMFIKQHSVIDGLVGAALFTMMAVIFARQHQEEDLPHTAHGARV